MTRLHQCGQPGYEDTENMNIRKIMHRAWGNLSVISYRHLSSFIESINDDQYVKQTASVV
jgi:hypothetical protein